MCLFHFIKIKIIYFFFILNISNVYSNFINDELFCFQKGPCQCSNNNGDVIDLSPLSNNTTPLTVSTSSYLYIYYPCQDFPLIYKGDKNDCTDKFGLCYFVPFNQTKDPINYNDVIQNKTFGSFYKLALNSEAVFSMNTEGKTEIIYKNIKDNNVITTIVMLHCDEKLHDYKLSVLNNSKDKHVLNLSTKYACLETSKHMSGFGVFMLILVVVAIIYFVGGILILKFLRGATGVEMIPNHEFWCGLPNSIKNCFNYIKSCGKEKPDTYDSI